MSSFEDKWANWGFEGSGESPFKAALAAYLVRQKLKEDLSKIDASKLDPRHVDPRTGDQDHLPSKPAACTPQEKHVDPKKLKVGIIGAGIAGLYTAHMLDQIGIDYEILEASKRIGGRLYTYHFKNPEGKPHQYYDIGAMRFPKTPVMRRTFDLFDRAKLELGEYRMASGDPDRKPVVEGKPAPMRYNDRTSFDPPTESGDPFHVSTKNGGNVPPEGMKNPSIILDDAYDRFRQKIKRAMLRRDRTEEDLQAAWKYLMNHDRFSLRDYLSEVEGYDYETIHWLETQFSATNWFDEAFTENVLESLAFEFINDTDKKERDDLIEALRGPKTVEWKYIEGGTSKLTDAMLTLIKKQPETEKRVIAIAKEEPTPEDENCIKVYVDGETEPRRYATVINTTTLAALQKMDLTGLQLPYAMKAAIRSLRYDPSTKVAIQFESPWWIKTYDIKGGLGKTDMPLRTCVYPSYNLHDGGGEAVLLCSYTWGQDSERIAAMVPAEGMGQEESDRLNKELKQTMLSNLARLHTTTKEEYEALLPELENSVKAIHGYDWSKDPYTCGGAFALYAPGQFSKVYANLVRPAADARFHIVGEAASAHHAWIVGALDSAYRGVWAFLERFHLHDLQDDLENKHKFYKCDEMSDTHLQVAFGRLKPEQQPKLATPAIGTGVR